MEVIKCLGNLFEETAANFFFDLPVRALMLDVLVQRDAADVVGHDADLLRGLD